MKFLQPLKSGLSLITGAFAVFAALAVTTPAQAQGVACPPGYGYSYGYGCVPVAPAYATIYPPPPVTYAPPVYDTFGLVFGGGSHGHPHYDHGFHGHDDHH